MRSSLLPTVSAVDGDRGSAIESRLEYPPDAMIDLPRLQDLNRRTRALARHDFESKVFGASMHDWKVFVLTPDEQAEAEARHGATLPEAYRWWVGEGIGAGLGPFYGIQHPLDAAVATTELEGAIPLSDHGCGYADYLMTRGENAGQVWVDFRESGGPLTKWYASLEDWLEAWLVRSYAEWGVEYLAAATAPRADETFLREVGDAMTRVEASSDDPMLAQYPVPRDKLRVARGKLHLEAGRYDEARAAFAAAAEISKEPEAMRALGECAIAKARGDAAAELAAADEGLAAQALWWISRKQLLVHRSHALESLGRADESVAAWAAVAEHDPNDLSLQLEAARVLAMKGAVERAVLAIRATATRGTGCDPKDSLEERTQFVANGVLAALRARGEVDAAEALSTSLAGSGEATN